MTHTAAGEEAASQDTGMQFRMEVLPDMLPRWRDGHPGAAGVAVNMTGSQVPRSLGSAWCFRMGTASEAERLRPRLPGHQRLLLKVNSHSLPRA